MKKLLSALVVLSMAVAANAGMIVPKISIDNAGSSKSSANGQSMTSDIDMGFAIGVDYLKKVGDKFMVGGGLEYQLARKASKVDGKTPAEEQTSYFVPVYVTGQYCFLSSSKLMPYAKLNLGYNIMYGGNSAFKSESTTKGGVYYAAGVGATVVSNVVVEFMYASFTGTRADTVVAPGVKLDIEDVYTTMSLKVGYKFDKCCKKK